jgi:hypothetical protein
MNDFAAPIIQAFLQGQQMKRQTEQDVIAAKEREKESKRYDAQLKRIEQSDKISNAYNMLQLREHVAKGIGDGSIITQDPGLEAQQMGPVGQQLMQMQAPPAQNIEPAPTGQNMPLQEAPMQVSQAPMQLGPEFNIGSTGQFRDPIVDIGGIKFDTREFRGPEETQKAHIQRLLATAGVDAQKAALVEQAKFPYRQAAQIQKDKSAMDRVKTQTQAQKDISTANNIVRVQANTEAAAARKVQAEVKKAHNEQMYDLAKRRLGIAVQKLDQNKGAVGNDITATVDQFKAGVLGKDDVSKVPIKQRNALYNRLQSEGVTMLDNKQKAGVADFYMLKEFKDTVRELSNAYSANPILGNDMIGPVADIKNRLKGILEPVGRKFDYKGVLTDKDSERLLGFATSKFTSKAEDLKREQLIDRFIVQKFNAEYPSKSISLQQRRDLAKRAGVSELIFPEVK